MQGQKTASLNSHSSFPRDSKQSPQLARLYLPRERAAISYDSTNSGA